MTVPPETLDRVTLVGPGDSATSQARMPLEHERAPDEPSLVIVSTKQYFMFIIEEIQLGVFGKLLLQQAFDRQAFAYASFGTSR